MKDVTSLKFREAGLTLFAGNMKGEVVEWQYETNRLINSWTASSGPVRATVSRGTTVISSGDDGTIRVHDRSQTKPQILQGHTEAVLALAISADGKGLLSADQKGELRLWNFAEGILIHAWQGQPVAVHAICFSSDGRRAISAGADNTVHIWQLPFY